MALHRRFFEAGQIDLDAARVMTNRALYQPAIYHLQQAYEKCIKSYLIFKEVNINNTPEATVYDNIRRLGHDTVRLLICSNDDDLSSDDINTMGLSFTCFIEG